MDDLSPHEIQVQTGARLHFGLLAHGQPQSRAFGGLGVMLDRPGFQLVVGLAARDELDCGPWESRVRGLLDRLRVVTPVGPVRVRIEAAPPAHAGFGSGTQLGMALALGLSRLAGEPPLKAAELARRSGRGLRSALGLHGFLQGGLLLEAGHFQPGEISPLVARLGVPDAWRFLLIRPRNAPGVSGSEEVAGFARLPPMSIATTEHLCRLVVMEILPAVVDRDFRAAERAIGNYGRLVGEYFAPLQGGVLANAQMRRLETELRDRGIEGYGQSSWGPTVFVLCPDAQAARTLQTELAACRASDDCEFVIAAPLNSGASCREVARRT